MENLIDLALILKAASFAAENHRHQRRKDAEASPYINHPLALASVLANGAGITDTATVCAALLHDTIEDTQTSADEIEREFEWEIRSLVEEVPTTRTFRKRSASACRLSTRCARAAKPNS